MADIQEAVRRLTIVSTSTGVDETTAKLNKLAGAQDSVAVASDKSSKASLSYEQAYARQSLRLDETARMQTKYSQEQKIAQGALSQGIITASDYAARMDLIGQKYGTTSALSRAFTQSLSGVQGQLVALASGAGPVGVFLSALGPWGLAAAVGIGAAEKALGLMSGAAHDLAQKAEELRRFSEATGLTTDQVQALRGEASKFGLTGEEVATAVQNFTARFNELRVGQGDLLTQIRRINPALAEQMAGATSASQAMTLFGQALNNVDNVFQRNALMKAAVGRGGPSIAQFFQGLNVDQLTESFNQVGHALDDKLIQKLATLEIQIEKTSHHARDNLASIFAEPVLEAELKFVQSFEHLTEILRDFKTGGSWSKFISDISSSSFVNGAMVLLSGGAAAPRLFLNKPNAASGPAAGGSGLGLHGGSPEASGASTGPTAQFLAEALRAQISAMGDAATYAQKLSLAQQDLAIKGHDAGLSQTQLARAAGMLKQSSDLQQMREQVGLLGQMATASQLLAVKTAEVDLANQKLDPRYRLNNQQLAGAKALAEANIQDQILQRQATLGIADATQLALAPQQQLDALMKAGLVTEKDKDAVLTMLAKKYRDLGDAAQVAGSKLPQLTQLMLDAGNGWKQLDTAATQSLGSLNNSLLDFETGAKSGKDAMHDFELQFIRSLLNMMNQMLIIQPIAMALKSSLGFGGGGGFFGGLFGGGGGGAGGSIAADGTAFIAHTGGVVGSGSLAGRYVHPAYFDGASRFAMGGIAGLGPDEVPIIAHRNEEVLRADDPRHRFNGGGGSPRVAVNVINNAGANVGVGEAQSDGNGGFSLDVMIDKAVAGKMAQPGSRTNNALDQRFGVPQRPVRR